MLQMIFLIVSKVIYVFRLSKKYANYEAFKQFSIRIKHTLENISTKYIDKTIESMPKRILKGKNKNKLLKVKLKAKFVLYRFILTKAVCLEIPGLDLARNTLLILLCFAYLFT